MGSEFPTFEQIVSQIPPGRKGYMLARQAYITRLAGDDPHGHHIAAALLDVAHFHQEGELSPPLSAELGQAVMNAAGFLSEGSAKPRAGYVPHLAACLLEVIVEHGYNPAPPAEQ